MRRITAPIATLVVATLALVGCSASGETTDPETSGTSDGTFPVSVDTAFGAVEVSEEPTRIVALGWGDAETALALGVQPVGASDWLGFGGEGVGPWAEGLYDEAPVIIETLEPDYEQIAALEPDLILDVKGSGDQERYDRLSEIATTIGIPEGGENYLTTGDQQLEMIAAALGQAERGEELAAEVDATFTAAAGEHPDWEGRTATAATRTSEGWGAYVESDARVQFLERLGFVQSPTIAALDPDANGFSVSISAEELDQLDADLIAAFPIFIATTEITDDPQWQAIPAVQDGRAVVIDGDVAAAYSLGTTLALQYAVEQVVPQIAEALGS